MKMLRICGVVCSGVPKLELIQSTVDPKCILGLARKGDDWILEGLIPEGRYLFLFRLLAEYKLYNLGYGEEDVQDVLCEGFRYGTAWKFCGDDGTTSIRVGNAAAGLQGDALLLQPGAWKQLEAFQNSWTGDRYLVALRDAVMEAVGFVPTQHHNTRVTVSEHVAKLSDLLKRLERAKLTEEVLERVGEVITQMLWYADGNPVAGLLGERDSARTLGQLIADMLHGVRDLCGQTVPVPEPPHPMQLIKTIVPPSLSARTTMPGVLKQGDQ